jgi:hypothetical protein
MNSSLNFLIAKLKDGETTVSNFLVEELGDTTISASKWIVPEKIFR